MRLLLSGLLATTLLTPALAADIYKAPPPAPRPAVVAPVTNWTGLYVGVNLGWGWQHGTVDVFSRNAGVQQFIEALDQVGFKDHFRPDGNGVIGGGQIGYNYQIGPYVVLGVETDFSGADIKGKDAWDATHAVPHVFPAASSITVDESLRWLGTTRARLGVTPLPSILIYGTGGVAYGDVKTDAAWRFPPLTGSVNDSAVQVGWVAGAGAEYRFTPSWIARAEWLHYDLGDRTFDIPKTDGLVSIKAKASGDIARAGLSYLFQ